MERFGDGPPPDGDAAADARARRMHPHMSETQIARIGHLQRLGARELVEARGREVKASDHLFD
jgi:hypothetical protein